MSARWLASRARDDRCVVPAAPAGRRPTALHRHGEERRAVDDRVGRPVRQGPGGRGGRTGERPRWERRRAGPWRLHRDAGGPSYRGHAERSVRTGWRADAPVDGGAGGSCGTTLPAILVRERPASAHRDGRHVRCAPRRVDAAGRCNAAGRQAAEGLHRRRRRGTRWPRPRHARAHRCELGDS